MKCILQNILHHVVYIKKKLFFHMYVQYFQTVNDIHNLVYI